MQEIIEAFKNVTPLEIIKDLVGTVAIFIMLFVALAGVAVAETNSAPTSSLRPVMAPPLLFNHAIEEIEGEYDCRGEPAYAVGSCTDDDQSILAMDSLQRSIERIVQEVVLSEME